LTSEGSAERPFAVVVTAAFVVLTVPRLMLHELWRDEAWLWLVVEQSHGLPSLFGALERSGQGCLFPVLCWLASLASPSPRAMQAVHLLIAAGAAFVFARWAPLARRERALFVLGYFPFWEYAVLSRHYAAGALLAFLACAVAGMRRPVIALGAVLGLLCQTTVYGWILAISLAAGWLVRIDVASLRRSDAVVGAALALAGAVAGVIQLIPSEGTSFAPGWQLGWDAAHAADVLAMPWRAFVPAPVPGLHFWNTNLLDGHRALLASAGAATLALALAILRPRRAAVVAFAVGAAGLLAFGYVKYIGLLRHIGHFWLLFAAALWLGGGREVLGARRSWRTHALLALLVVHCGAAAYASVMDVRHPFSNGAAVAALIRAEGLDRFPLLAHREPPASSVALALGTPWYSPSRRVFTTYPDWGPEQRDLDPAQLRCTARDLARREESDVVLVMTSDLPPWPEVELVGARLGAIQASEDYRVYRLRRDRLASTATDAACDGR
jgi:hypothetical protein